jgi:hypothetical protein
MQASTAPIPAKLAPTAVRLAALWVLGVTSIKLFRGSPNDLPAIIRDHFFGPKLNFNLSIGIELSCAFVAMLYPRRGFAPLTALSVVFIGVLTYLISIGATSCGCFGGAIKFSPWLMLTVDASLLACMLATKPWTSIRPTKFPALLAGVAVIAAFAAPWLLIKTATIPAPVNTTVDGSVPAVWQLPPKPWPRYVDVHFEKHIGDSIHSTELAPWMDTHAYQMDAAWIFYRVTCPHCADYLRQLSNEYTGEQMYVLVRVIDPDDEEKKPWLVDQMPPGEKAELPGEVDFVLTPGGTPCEVVLEHGIVKTATYRAEE